MNFNVGNGFNSIGANNFANMFSNKSVGGTNNNKDFVQKSLEKLTDTYEIKANMDDNSVISSEMKAQIKGLEDSELSIQDSMAMLQIAENALYSIAGTVNEMYDLVSVVADGTINDAQDILDIQAKLGELANEVADIYDKAIYGDTNALETVLSPANSDFSFDTNEVQDSQVATISSSDETYGGDILINGETPTFTGETLEVDRDELNALLEQMQTQTASHETDGLSNLDGLSGMGLDLDGLTCGEKFVKVLGLDTLDITTDEGIASALEVLTVAKGYVDEGTKAVLAQMKELESMLNSNRHSVDTSDEDLQEYINELTEYVKKDVFDDPSLILLAQEKQKPEKVKELTE